MALPTTKTPAIPLRGPSAWPGLRLPQAGENGLIHQNTGSEMDPDARPIVLLFCDDSTLFFALRMRDILRLADNPPPIEMAWYLEEDALSYRQITQLLPEGPDRALGRVELQQLLRSPDVMAILTSRVFRPMANALKKPLLRHSGNRPCVVAFLGGLDFSPERGFQHRMNCDGVYLFPRSSVQIYEEIMQERDVGWQEVGFGHPSFLRPADAPADLAERRDIYFFTQAVSPSSKRGRKHMLQAMAAIARNNPDRKVWIKLRHLPNENDGHLHREKYDYPGLMEAMGDLPENLEMTACTMDEALETAALGITCTSTAAIDVLRAGIPTMVHLDFVDNYLDPLVVPMRGLFEQSNIITSLEDMLRLRAHAPDPAWVDTMFCSRDLGGRVIATVDNFHNRPIRIQPNQDSQS